MFSEGFRQVPRKLIKLTIENPTALWLYCYLVDKMDDRVEMECLINVTLTAKIIGIPKTTLRSIMYFLADIGAISITTGRKGYLVKAINYQNNQSVKARIENGSKTDRNLDRNLDRKLQSEDISIKDILGDTADIVGSSFGSSFGSNSDRKSDRTGGVLDSGEKREKRKRKKSTSSLSTASVDSADPQEDSKASWLTLVNHWNEQLPTHQKVIVSILRKNEKRKKDINSIISNVGIEMLFDTIKSISKSEFLNGKNDRNWKPDFDWILDVKNVQKVLENKYMDKQEKVMQVEKAAIIEEYVPKISWEERIKKLYGH